MDSFKTILPIGIGQYLFLLVALSVSSCVDDHMNIESSLDGMLQIHVVTNHVETKDAIFDSYLPDKSVVGVWLTDSEGDSYITSSNETFELYTAEGEGMSQSWYSHRKIALDERTATVYASYPGADADGILSIKSDQTDYMYATPTTVSRSNPLASLVMNHALSIIEFSSVKSSVYSGAGTINSFKISSPVIASSGELDVKTGIISDFGDAFPVELPVSDLTLSDVPAVGHIIVIPRGVSGVLTLSVKVDNVWHSVKTNPITLEQGKKYHYDLSIGGEYVQVGEVQVTDWVDNHVGDETIEYGNFKINLTGDKENLAFAHSVSNGVVTIKAVSLSSAFYPSVVTKSGDATFSQSLSDSKVRTVTLSSIMSDIDVKFDGLSGGELIISGTTTGLTVTKERTSDNSFRVVATPSALSTYATAPTIGSGKATLSQSVSKFIRTIDVNDMKSNVVLNFNGTSPVTDLITWAGNTSGLTYTATIADGTPTSNKINVSIKPTVKHYYPKTVTTSTTAVLSTEQSLSLDGNSERYFTMSMTDACTIYLNGYVQTKSWSSINTDGVYYVDMNGQCALNASTNCIGVALVNTAANQKFIIEKYEDDGPCYKQTMSDKFPNYSKYSWSSSAVIDGVTKDSLIYEPGGNILGTEIPADPTLWTKGSLSDFGGLENSRNILVYWMNNSTKEDFSTHFCPMGELYWYIETAHEKDSKVGSSYWYVPAHGQLALIYLNISAINSALSRIGGKPFTMTDSENENSSSYYWSSTQGCGYKETMQLWKLVAFTVDFSRGFAGAQAKYNPGVRVRFIRDCN